MVLMIGQLPGLRRRGHGAEPRGVQHPAPEGPRAPRAHARPRHGLGGDQARSRHVGGGARGQL